MGARSWRPLLSLRCWIGASADASGFRSRRIHIGIRRTYASLEGHTCVGSGCKYNWKGHSLIMVLACSNNAEPPVARFLGCSQISNVGSSKALHYQKVYQQTVQSIFFCSECMGTLPMAAPTTATIYFQQFQAESSPGIKSS